MVNGKPLFTGVSENDQLKKIFRIRGTPNEKLYPEAKSLPEWNPENFDEFPEEDILKYVPKLDADGVDLLLKMLQIDPEKRISADEALKHPYFDDIQLLLKEIYK